MTDLVSPDLNAAALPHYPVYLIGPRPGTPPEREFTIPLVVSGPAYYAAPVEAAAEAAAHAALGYDFDSIGWPPVNGIILTRWDEDDSHIRPDLSGAAYPVFEVDVWRGYPELTLHVYTTVPALGVLTRVAAQAVKAALEDYDWTGVGTGEPVDLVGLTEVRPARTELLNLAPPEPEIEAITPDRCPAAIPAPITITGTQLGGATRVTFMPANQPATGVRSVDNQTVTCTTPAASVPGSQEVTVEAAAGTAVRESAIRFTLPFIDHLDPAEGRAGDETVIVGEGFAGHRGFQIRFGAFGNVGDRYTVDSDTAITCTVPTGTGTVAVEVTPLDGLGHTKPNAFTYLTRRKRGRG